MRTKCACFILGLSFRFDVVWIDFTFLHGEGRRTTLWLVSIAVRLHIWDASLTETNHLSRTFQNGINDNISLLAFLCQRFFYHCCFSLSLSLLLIPSPIQKTHSLWFRATKKARVIHILVRRHQMKRSIIFDSWMDRVYVWMHYMYNHFYQWRAKNTAIRFIHFMIFQLIFVETTSPHLLLLLHQCNLNTTHLVSVSVDLFLHHLMILWNRSE